ncbi:NAD-dependent epimerase [Peribacillus simplex]|uniref:Capsular biosynthesis protein CpsI n=2 Tax=Peribacillus simplex TaxID=1478 RepID=A0A223ENY0_9BACI|nr:NAD-dependent epimerase [Peribacillus simplex]ASS96942.1 capsular biosynthesis protein CpsI [Peribacillus simplex NBRC 15720 = DSM 1321]MEC1398721.1 NAD-dependent epimerase [Peribacillus simplex]MED3912159.1 NAD-dependent epimerase [Peribacillus simplex]TVX83866.1 NAD-dependent epimerase [Peribacillus simplex]
MNIIVTGAAGFIGFHLTKRLLAQDINVIGVDNINDYYDVFLKNNRLKILEENPDFEFHKMDLLNKEKLNQLFKDRTIDIVINLAAQAGVRYSIDNPDSYVNSNLVGFVNILEVCRHNNVKHLIYASSSSVYGANTNIPFSTKDPVDHPVSLYAATKKSNELMAHTYSHLYNIPTTGLRFFTVYGPWGRPDMAYYSFTKNIIEENTIKVFNNGDMRRDFTYIDDIVEGIIRLLDKPPVCNIGWDRANPDSSSSYAPYKIYNIGNNKPIKLMDFINTLEKLIGKKAKIEFLPMQPGDVKETYADIADLNADVGFYPSTTIEEGLTHFVNWYNKYNK